jgi:hypothetical protein
MRPRLKLFFGDDQPATVPEVSMNLGEFTRILREAIEWDSTWLQDFSNDTVQVSADLYEILSMYSHLRPSA